MRRKFEPVRFLQMCIFLVPVAANKKDADFIQFENESSDISLLNSENKEFLIYRNMIKKECYVEKLSKIHSDEEQKSRTLYLEDMKLNDSDKIFKQLGADVMEFCQDCSYFALTEKPPFNKIFTENSQPLKRKRRYAKHYKGQTQTQFIAFNSENKDDKYGVAEAVAEPDRSRAVVSGHAGMGQAQSQSVNEDNCDEQTQKIGNSYSKDQIISKNNITHSLSIPEISYPSVIRTEQNTPTSIPGSIPSSYGTMINTLSKNNIPLISSPASKNQMVATEVSNKNPLFLQNNSSTESFITSKPLNQTIFDQQIGNQHSIIPSFAGIVTQVPTHLPQSQITYDHPKTGVYMPTLSSQYQPGFPLFQSNIPDSSNISKIMLQNPYSLQFGQFIPRFIEPNQQQPLSNQFDQLPIRQNENQIPLLYNTHSTPNLPVPVITQQGQDNIHSEISSRPYSTNLQPASTVQEPIQSFLVPNLYPTANIQYSVNPQQGITQHYLSTGIQTVPKVQIPTDSIQHSALYEPQLIPDVQFPAISQQSIPQLTNTQSLYFSNIPKIASQFLSQQPFQYDTKTSPNSLLIPFNNYLLKQTGIIQQEAQLPSMIGINSNLVPNLITVPIVPTYSSQSSPAKNYSSQVPVQTGYLPSNQIPIQTGYLFSNRVPVQTSYSPSNQVPVEKDSLPSNQVSVKTGYLSSSSQAPMQTGYLPSNQVPVQTSYSPSNQVPMQTGYSFSSQVPMQTAGYSLSNQVPVQTGYSSSSQVPTQTAGYSLSNQVPVQTGYLPSNQVSAKTGYLPSSNQAPMQTGYLPSNQVPGQTSYLPSNQAPVQAQIPGQTGYLPSNQVPVQTAGYSLSNQVPVQTDYLPSNQVPAQTGYLPSNQVLAKTGYLPSSSQAPMQTGYLPSNQVPVQTSYSSSNQVPVQTGYSSSSQVPTQTAGYSLSNQVPVQTGYLPSNQVSAKTGYLPSSNQAPMQTGYLPSNQVPGQTSYLPSNQAPVQAQIPGQTGYLPSNQVPVQTSYSPLIQAPLQPQIPGQTGYLPSNQVQVQTGYSPSNKTPMQTGYSLSNQVPAQTQTPGQTGYLPSNQVPLQTGYFLSSSGMNEKNNIDGQTRYIPQIPVYYSPEQIATNPQQTGFNYQNYLSYPRQINPEPANRASQNQTGINKSDKQNITNIFQNVTNAEFDETQSVSDLRIEGNNTVIGASAEGKTRNGIAKSHVSGTYSGSFSAQAETSDYTKSAKTLISGNTTGAMSISEGVAGNSQSQSQFHYNHQEGSSIAESQGKGINYTTNSQIKSGIEGGTAGAQAFGLGNTLSQAQIGFTPQNENFKQKSVFHNGGSSSSQNSAYSGQSEINIHNLLKNGLSISGFVQASAGQKAQNQTLSSLNTNKESNKYNFNENRTTEEQNYINQLSKSKKSNPTNANNTKNNTSNNLMLPYEYQPQLQELPNNTPLLDNLKKSVNGKENNDEDILIFSHLLNSRIQSSQNENDFKKSEEKDDPEKLYQSNKRRRNNAQVKYESKKKFPEQPSQAQEIYLKSNEHDAYVYRDSSDTLDEKDAHKNLLDTKGKVISIAGDKTEALATIENSQAQTQTVLIKPGTGRIIIKNRNPLQNNNIQNDAVSIENKHSLDNYKATKNIKSDEINENKKYTYFYYWKSSKCGSIKMNCDLIENNDGATKICKPDPQTHSDGTPC